MVDYYYSKVLSSSIHILRHGQKPFCGCRSLAVLWKLICINEKTELNIAKKIQRYRKDKIRRLQTFYMAKINK